MLIIVEAAMVTMYLVFSFSGGAINSSLSNDWPCFVLPGQSGHNAISSAGEHITLRSNGVNDSLTIFHGGTAGAGGKL